MTGPDAKVLGWRRDVRLGVVAFYIIAAATILNSLILQTGRFINLLAGIYLTQVVDAVGQGMRSLEPEGAPDRFVPLLFLVFDAGIAAVIALLGSVARRVPKAFVAGIIMYSLDAIVFALVRQWPSVVVHVVILVIVYRGYIAACSLEQRTEAGASGTA